MPKKTVELGKSIHNYPSFIHILHCVIISLFVAAVYLQTLKFQFVWDDINFNIVANPYINKKEAAQLAPFWQDAYAKLYIPITYTAWYLQAKLSRFIFPNYVSEDKLNTTDLNPSIFHFFNILLHLLNSLLVYILICKISPLNSNILGFISALLFSIHPIQIEVVAWVTGLKDLLATFFMLTSLLCWIFYRSTEKKAFYIYALLLFLCSLLSKPSSVILPIIFITLDILHYRISLRKSLLSNERLILISIGWLIFTKQFQPHDEITFNPPIWARVYIALDSLFFYISKVLWPLPLCIDYGRTPQFLIQQPWLGITASIPIIIGLVIYRIKNSVVQKNSILLYIAFIIALSPTLGLISYEYQSRYSSVADRYAYLALIPASIILSTPLFILISKTPIIARYLIILSIFIPIACITYQHTKRWENNLTLYQTDIQVNPLSQHLQVNYAVAYSTRYPHDISQVIPNALKSVQIQHDFYEGLNTLGVLYGEIGENELALRYLKRAAFVRPDLDKPPRNIALILFKAKEYEKSIPYFEQYIKLHPKDVEILNRLADAYYHLKKWPEAIKYYERCTQLMPTLTQAHIGVSASAINLQKYTTALKSAKDALRLDPNSYDAHLNLASALIGLKKYQEAILPLEKASKIQPHSPEPHRLLAAIYESLSEHQKKAYHLRMFHSLTNSATTTTSPPSPPSPNKTP
ncbi:MAG: tetratricopeptide repeat protein [Methylacidiphilales bacterium]|nr:tetratricopeptide repeat protein [Candidatus Methylacidiphilales bacterium]